MSENIKSLLKKFLRNRPILAIWVARIRALTLGLFALVYRVRYVFYSYVPLSVKLVGAHRISIGRNSAIGAGSWLNVNDFKGETAALTIGDNCFIGRDNFFSVGEIILVKDYSLTTKGCAFIGASHIYDNPMLPYGTTGIKGENKIDIGVNCFFGAFSRVIGNVTIGHGSVIGAGAEVREDILPFSLVVGSPAKVIKRYDFAQQAWVKWPAENYTEGPQEEEYLQQLKLNTGAPLLHLSAAAGMLNDIV